MSIAIPLCEEKLQAVPWSAIGAVANLATTTLDAPASPKYRPTTLKPDSWETKHQAAAQGSPVASASEASAPALPGHAPAAPEPSSWRGQQRLPAGQASTFSGAAEICLDRLIPAGRSGRLSWARRGGEAIQTTFIHQEPDDPLKACYRQAVHRSTAKKAQERGLGIDLVQQRCDTLQSLRREDCSVDGQAVLFVVASCVKKENNRPMFRETFKSVVKHHPEASILVVNNCVADNGTDALRAFSECVQGYGHSQLIYREHSTSGFEFRAVIDGSLLLLSQPRFEHMVFLQHSTRLSERLPNEVFCSCGMTVLNLPWTWWMRGVTGDEFVKEFGPPLTKEVGVPEASIELQTTTRWFPAMHGTFAATRSTISFWWRSGLLNMTHPTCLGKKTCWEFMGGVVAAWSSPRCVGVFPTLEKTHGGNRLL